MKVFIDDFLNKEEILEKEEKDLLLEYIKSMSNMNIVDIILRYYGIGINGEIDCEKINPIYKHFQPKEIPYTLTLISILYFNNKYNIKNDININNLIEKYQYDDFNYTDNYNSSLIRNKYKELYEYIVENGKGDYLFDFNSKEMYFLTIFNTGSQIPNLRGYKNLIDQKEEFNLIPIVLIMLEKILKEGENNESRKQIIEKFITLFL